MATLPSMTELLSSIIDSCTSAAAALPSSESIKPPADGVSLFDTKNELLLSYLQHIVFLILLKVKNIGTGKVTSEISDLHANTVKQLITLRTYLEKGVRPLEAKLKYQLDKLLAAAADAEEIASEQKGKSAPIRQSKNTNGQDRSRRNSNSDAEDTRPDIPVSDLSYRPNPSAFVRPSADTRMVSQDKSGSGSGVYKPPRITPTALPTTSNNPANRNNTARARKSATMDAFIREELTDAPVMESSIGAGSGLRGRAREKDEERRAYEETRLMRLPEDKKKVSRDKRKMIAGNGAQDLEIGFGGGSGLDDVDFGRHGRKKKRMGEEGGMARRAGRSVGEDWERRVRKGVKGKMR